MIIKKSKYQRYLIVWVVLMISIGLLIQPAAADTQISGSSTAATKYELPAQLDSASQAKANQAMDEIVALVEKDMNAAMEPLIPQFAAMIVRENKALQPEINGLINSQVKPSVKQYVENDAKIIGPQVSALVQQKVAGMQDQIIAAARSGSDPTQLIISALKSSLNSPEVNKIIQDAVDRAKQEQQKNAQDLQPQVQKLVQKHMDSLTVEMQKMVQVQLQKSVPEEKKIVDARIDQMIIDSRAGLPEQPKGLPDQLRSDCEKAMYSQISKQLFEVVAVDVDQKVVAGIKDDTLKSIREILAPQNKEISNYAVEVGLSNLPSQVDQYGMRPEIEALMRKTTEANLQASEDALMAQIQNQFEQQAGLTNQKMHTFVYEQVNKLLGIGSTAVSPQANATTDNSAITVSVNGQQLQFDVPPVVNQGRTLVPLRAIFQALGAVVTWDQNTQVVNASKGSTQIILKPGEPNAIVNGSQVALQVPASIVDGRTMVPVRFVSEALGAQVDWDESSRSIIIK